jgi:isoquinoline 1-oxidoreductase beta subunit
VLGFAFIDYSGTLTAGIAEVSLDRRGGQINVHNFWCTLDCEVAPVVCTVFPRR